MGINNLMKVSEKKQSNGDKQAGSHDLLQSKIIIDFVCMYIA